MLDWKNLPGCEEAAAGRAGILTAAKEETNASWENREANVGNQEAKYDNHTRFLQVEAEDWVDEGQGAGMLSLRSQVKLIPVSWSNIASDGKLGNRQPDSLNQKEQNIQVNKMVFMFSRWWIHKWKIEEINSHLGFQLFESNHNASSSNKNKENGLRNIRSNDKEQREVEVIK